MKASSNGGQTPLRLPRGGGKARVKGEKRKIVSDLKDFKGFGVLRLKLYLELLFRILKIILRFNFKLHFEPEATK